MNEKDFFYFLLKESHTAFERSPIKKYQDENKKDWNYSVCATPLQKEQGIIFGLNWGGDKGDPQKEYPTDEKLDWKFINNSKKYFEHYLDISSIKTINYSNLCFFRSPKINYLKPEDWESSMPLFKKYVDYINPPWLVLLGKVGVNILNQYNCLSAKSEVAMADNRITTYGYKATLFDKYEFYCVPHPQARISIFVRDSIWEKLFT